MICWAKDESQLMEKPVPWWLLTLAEVFRFCRLLTLIVSMVLLSRYHDWKKNSRKSKKSHKPVLFLFRRFTINLKIKIWVIFLQNSHHWTHLALSFPPFFLSCFLDLSLLLDLCKTKYNDLLWKIYYSIFTCWSLS